EEIHGNAQRFGSARKLSPSQFAAGIKRRVNLLAGTRILRARVDLARCRDLRRRQTIGRVGAFALSHAGIEMAAFGSSDDAVGQSVVSIASLQCGLMKNSVLGGGNEAGVVF